MTTTLTTTFPLDVSLSAVATALRSADFARTRINAAGRHDVELLSHVVDGDAVRLSWRSTTPTDAMPSWMRLRYRTSGPSSVRTEEWHIGSEAIEGTFVQSSPELDGTLAGSHSITGSGDGLVWQVRANSDYTIPIIGSKIERFSLEALKTAVAAEAEVFEQVA